MMLSDDRTQLRQVGKEFATRKYDGRTYRSTVTSCHLSIIGPWGALKSLLHLEASGPSFFVAMSRVSDAHGLLLSSVASDDRNDL